MGNIWNLFWIFIVLVSVLPIVQQKIMQAKRFGLIRKLKESGKTILFIEHDLHSVMDIAEKIIVLDHGKKIAEGTPEEIKQNKEVLKAYLGKESL